MALGWKSDNGFRAGYLMKLEDSLKCDFPGIKNDANAQFMRNKACHIGSIGKRYLARIVWGGDGVVERLIAALKKLKENTNSCPEALSQRIGFEFDSSKARKEVYKILGTILGLSKAQKFDVSEIILGKAKHVDIFLALPEEDHPNLIRDFEGPAVFAVPELLAGPEDHSQKTMLGINPRHIFIKKNEKNGPAMFAVLCRDFEEGPAVFAVPELLAEPEDHVRNQPKTYFH
ncbi:hypothetical protein SASPL_137357 [Salvia splendens]|uniref:Uncharacterized protein n=1 Tax=Salvia splendens TaxID=180675 RepID=A0A8X8WU75_SALSN|nr:hypothetical protein SASPL_137357 [Salvia splendens]